jgi:uncharacterized protein YlxP (DUF503 family)
MHILVLTVELLLPSRSLKAKRGIVKSLVARARNRYNVSASEVDQQDDAERAVLAFSTVSESGVHARRLLDQLEEWIPQEKPEVEIVRSEIVDL